MNFITAARFAVFFIVCIQQLLNANPTNQKITASAIKYMASLGYYNYPDASLGQIANEKDIRQAVMDMQRFAGIPPSGIVDDATRTLMETPRCGMKDINKNLISAKRKRRFVLQGTKWQKEDLTWKLVNDNNDGLTRKQVEDVLARAFDKWHKVTNLNFKKLDVSDSTEPDIVVKFSTNYHDDAYPFDGPGGTLAHAFYPYNNKGITGDIHFDDDEVYTIDSPRGRSLLWVAVHEIGHSIGLEHSNIQEAVMYPWYRGNGGKDFDLNEDDKLGVQNIYGLRATDPEKPVTGTTTTTSTAAPKPGVTLPPKPQCTADFQAAFLHSKTEKSYIINNDAAYILGKRLGIEKGPIAVKEIFPGIDSADAMYEKRDGNIVVFKGRKYYIYNNINGNQLESGNIQTKYGVKDDVDKIDAAFIWNGNGRTYLFAGNDYYRFDDARQSMDYGYPKDIASNWKGLPKSVNGVMIWRNKVTYFFKDKMYYRFNDQDIKVDDGYPKPINPIWTKCSVGQLQQDTGKSASISTFGSTILTALMVFVVKLFQ